MASNSLDPVGTTDRATLLKHGAGVGAVAICGRREEGYFVPVLRCRMALTVVAGLMIGLGSRATAAEFSNASSLLAAPTSSGVAMAVVDMDQDGKDDIVHFSNALNLMIDYQMAPGQAFDRVQLGAAGNTIIWGVAVGDADENGFPDIMTGGRYDGLRFYRAASGGRSFTSTNYNPSIFLQGINFVDINGDGRLDVFACHDEGENIKMLNSGNANFVETPGAINTGGYAGSYGSVWTDYDRDGDLDLYISKCSRLAPNDPLDPRRINQLFRNNGNGTYTEVAAAAGLAFGEQSWAADFADIDNDGDLDCFVGNHYDFSKLMRNNGDGTFSDITTSSGLSEYSLVIQGVFRDFDNDGWVDRVVDLVSRIPGVAACACVNGTNTVAHGGGSQTAQDFQRQAADLARSIHALAPLIGISGAETFSINTNDRLMTFSFHPPVALGVLHQDNDLAAGLRDKITLVGRELARLVSKAGGHIS